jgi:hypothetical protein
MDFRLLCRVGALEVCCEMSEGCERVYITEDDERRRDRVSNATVSKVAFVFPSCGNYKLLTSGPIQSCEGQLKLEAYLYIMAGQVQWGK